MHARRFLATLLLLGASGAAQIKHTSVPAKDEVDKALAKISLTDREAKPFHLRIVVSEPKNPQSPYQGTIEEWWTSPDQWRREITDKDGLHQTIVVSGGKKTERDEGDYFPLWLRGFLIAALDPIPDAAAYSGSALTIDQITLPDGRKSDPCIRLKSKIGTGDRATDAFSNVCFDGENRLKFYGSPRYSMEFADYRGFGKKQIARKLTDHPEPGTELIGVVALLEDLSKTTTPELFQPLPANDDRFRTVAISSEHLEQLTADSPPVVWPPVHSGNVRGKLAMYIATDSQGHIREAWPLNSDNAGLEDPARQQVIQWILKPLPAIDGKPVQVDGGLGFSFETKIGDPLPQLSDAETRAQATKIVEPIWPPGSSTIATSVEIEVSVDEKGELAGEVFSEVPSGMANPILAVINEWKFRPLIRDGHPQYFHGTLIFPVK